MPVKMTSKQRLQSAMRLEKPDRVPVGPFIAESFLEQAGPERALQLLAQTDILMNGHVVSDLALFLGKAALEQCRGWVRGDQHVRVIDTPLGELRSTTMVTEKTSCTTEFFFKGPEDVEKFLSVPYEPICIDATEFHRLGEHYGDEVLVLAGFPDAVCLPGFWFSPEDFMLNCMEDFGLIKMLLDTVQSRLIDGLRACMSAGVYNFRLIGAELASQTLMDPTWFAKLVAPYDSELHALIRKEGGIAYMHCHGRINDILEEIADTGPTALDPLERAPCGNLELADAKRRVGDRICLVGNLDDLEFIGAKNRGELLEASIACIQDAGPEGFILGGTASGIYTPQMAEGFLVMAEASRLCASRH